MDIDIYRAGRTLYHDDIMTFRRIMEMQREKIEKFHHRDRRVLYEKATQEKKDQLIETVTAIKEIAMGINTIAQKMYLDTPGIVIEIPASPYSSGHPSPTTGLPHDIASFPLEGSPEDDYSS